MKYNTLLNFIDKLAGKPLSFKYVAEPEALKTHSGMIEHVRNERAN